ncbi:MAG TPA: 3-deoxy-7-phosphoheptulonate synthase, partial [Myxococcaceae bacterium]|nr:3-deoxy-7-phosphoheptulonate synthase [Myxococcaceae bacterium]
MIITLDPQAPPDAVNTILEVVARHPKVTPRKHTYKGATETVTEIHLLAPPEIIQTIPEKLFADLPGVRSVVRVSTRYRLIGRHGNHETPGFEYNGVRFDERQIHIFAGLCAVDTRENVGKMMSALQAHGITTTRMGAYKPRTSPYDFQGLGRDCLPWTFELAGKHGIKIIAMEATHARHIEEIRSALEASGNATGVMLQVGTRNAQNFELLKQLGQQQTFPVLFKRGMGITLEESLNACEYIASEGNPKIIFCLRGVKTHLGDPHRNLVDFAHVPVVRRQTRLPVCVDPSHSVGRLDLAPDQLFDILHVIGQGLIAGASMALV